MTPPPNWQFPTPLPPISNDNSFTKGHYRTMTPREVVKKSPIMYLQFNMTKTLSYFVWEARNCIISKIPELILQFSEAG